MIAGTAGRTERVATSWRLIRSSPVLTVASMITSGGPIGTEVQHHGVAVVGRVVAVDDDVAVVDVGADLESNVVVDDDLDHADADAQVGA